MDNKLLDPSTEADLKSAITESWRFYTNIIRTRANDDSRAYWLEEKHRAITRSVQLLRAHRYLRGLDVVLHGRVLNVRNSPEQRVRDAAVARLTPPG